MLERLIGRTPMQLLKNWIPTVTTWGIVAGITVIYATDWKVIVGHIPYIKGKFKTD
ncbi:cytochrome b-c1 complex subunit 10 [Narcine bancroftii]|uniref:cytochrome b-c1 complex subunit 10 n=1 Tax=Narcine bancroftii TaxID=1343680 RepID=UPI003830FF6A